MQSCITIFIVLGWIFLGLLAAYGLRIHRLVFWPEQDPDAAGAISVLPLDGDPDRRVVPEWEPSRGLLVAYPFRLPLAMLREVAKEDPIYIIAKNERKMEQCLRLFKKQSINADQVEFIFSQHGTGHQFTRDWGPLTIQGQEGETLFDATYLDYPISGYDSSNTTFSWTTDFIPLPSYKRDNAAPESVARHFAVRGEHSAIALTGGAVMFDGQGTLFVHQLVLDENRVMGVSLDEFKGQLAKVLGVTRLIVLPNYESRGIQHIDCFLKLLDVRRLLVKRLDADHPDFERVERIVDGLSALETPQGEAYEILRIDTPNYAKGRAAPYTNSLIFNTKIFVPLMGIPGDAAAIETWEAAMPGHEVFGFQADKGMRPWRYADALHCRSKSVFLRTDPR